MSKLSAMATNSPSRSLHTDKGRQHTIKMRANKARADNDFLTHNSLELEHEHERGAGLDPDMVHSSDVNLADLDHDDDVDDDDDDTLPTFMYNGAHAGHLALSSAISLAVVLHAVYWEYAARSMVGIHHKFEHLQVSAAFACLNLVPALALFSDLYSPFISLAVVLHGGWLLYHTYASWVHDICSYAPFSQMCVAVSMYKNLTLSLLFVAVAHQALLVVYCAHQSYFGGKQRRVEQALSNAEDLALDELPEHSLADGDDELEQTEVFGGATEDAEDIALETPVEAALRISDLNLAELEERFRYFSEQRSHSSGHHAHAQRHSSGCKYCFWESQALDPSLSDVTDRGRHLSADDDTNGDAALATQTAQMHKGSVDVSDSALADDEFPSNLKVKVPKSTKRHAIPLMPNDREQ